MIISASRRTDIPALYPEWFMNRLRAGEVLVPNPHNRKRISRIRLSPEVVDCFVFWTKNPEPMIPYLKAIDKMEYSYYFQMTITDYDEDIEVNIPPVEESIATFRLLSERLGKERVDFRFDPVLLADKYTIDYHLEKFEMMCSWLHKHTTRCIFSFIDIYKNSPYREITEQEKRTLAEGFAGIAKKYDLPLYMCAETIDLSDLGIGHASCIDKAKTERVIGYKLDIKKDKGQRPECGCCESVDIGMYDSCAHGCRYCYANVSAAAARNRQKLHDPKSPLLIGNIQGDEAITYKDIRSNKDLQLSLFDFM